jgi:hypothetical protein
LLQVKVCDFNLSRIVAQQQQQLTNSGSTSLKATDHWFASCPKSLLPLLVCCHVAPQLLIL